MSDYTELQAFKYEHATRILSLAGHTVRVPPSRSNIDDLDQIMRCMDKLTAAAIRELQARVDTLEAQSSIYQEDAGAMMASRRWIPVSERLPESLNNPAMVSLDEIGFYQAWKENTWVHFHGSVTHWMPLPTPPAGESENE